MPSNPTNRLQQRVGIAFVLAAAAAPIFLHCSSDRPPGASLDDRQVDAPSTRPDARVVPDDGPSNLVPDATADADVVDAGADADTNTPCLGDTIDTSPDAAALASDGGIDCEGATAECEPLCERVRAHYRPGVAEDVARCIRALPGCAQLDVVLCVDRAIARACRETSATPYCTTLRASCFDETGDAAAELTQDGCEKFASAFSPTGRDVFANCIEAGTPIEGCPQTVVNCAEAIRQ